MCLSGLMATGSWDGAVGYSGDRQSYILRLTRARTRALLW